MGPHPAPCPRCVSFIAIGRLVEAIRRGTPQRREVVNLVDRVAAAVAAYDNADGVNQPAGVAVPALLSAAADLTAARRALVQLLSASGLED